MKIFSTERNNLLIFCIFGFLFATRIVIFQVIGIEPNQQYLINHWQHLNIDQLKESLFTTLLNLHSQPPLWNAIIGAASKICDGSESCVLTSLHYMNIGATFTTSVFIFYFLILVQFSRKASLLYTALFLILPSTIYYENYPFYPHISMLLVSAIIFFTLSLLKTQNTLYLAATLICLASLSWLMGIFHPILIFALGSAVLLLKPKNNKRKNLYFLVFTALLLAPPTKNYFLYGFFGTSSWLGLNVSQVAPKQIPGCTFDEFRTTMPEINHNGTAFNQVSVIDYASHCEKMAIQAIREDPLRFFAGRMIAFVNSIRKSPSDYFFPPVGFENYPRIAAGNSLRNSHGGFNPRILIDVIVAAFNIMMIAYILIIPFRTRSLPPTTRRAFAICGTLVLIVLLVGHATNGGEQERMRYSLNAVFLIAFALLIRDIRCWFSDQGRTRCAGTMGSVDGVDAPS